MPPRTFVQTGKQLALALTMTTQIDAARIGFLVRDLFNGDLVLASRDYFEAVGAHTEIVASSCEPTRPAPSRAFPADESRLTVDRVAERTAEDYDALVLPPADAGPPRSSDVAVALVSSMLSRGAPVGAIDNGVRLLVDAGVVVGRKVAALSDLRSAIERAQGEWVESPAYRDGCLVTARTRTDLGDFQRAMLDAIGRWLDDRLETKPSW